MVVSTGSFLLDLLGVFTALVVTVYAYYKWTFQYWQRRNIPYIEPKVPFGSFDNPFTKEISIGEEIDLLYRQAKSKGWKYCGLFNMAKPNLMVLDVDLLKHIFVKDFSHFTDRDVYTNEKDDPLGFNLFSMNGIKWKHLRVKLSPTFTSGKMKQMFQTLADTGIMLEKYLEMNVTGTEPVDIKETAARFATDIIGSCAFGLECNSFNDPNSPFRRCGKRAINQTTLEVIKNVFCVNFPTIGRMLRLSSFPKEATDFFSKIVEDTVDYREKNGVTRKDFMQLLIDIKNGKEKQQNGIGGDGQLEELTVTEIAAQCFIFFLGGFETSSTTMTFALYQLATHPELQDRVRDEINTVLARHNDRMTYDSLSELKYLKQVIDETLRMYAPLPLLSRECGEDYKIPGENVVIEKGTAVLIPVQGLHYDEEYYKDPKVFDPDRFSEENKKKLPPYTYLPFGEGPRICIGERFGVMQTKVGLTSILRRYRVKLSEKTKVPLKLNTIAFVPTVEGDIWLNLEKV